ncbi:MAG: PilN domain-containing protein [Luteimonas sp.]
MATIDNSSSTIPLGQRLGRVGGRLRPSLGALWAWWTQALATWLPARMRELFGLSQRRLLLQPLGDNLRLALERGDDLRDIGQLPWDAAHAALTSTDPLASLLDQRSAELPRWLLLPAAAGLRRTLALPAAAADRLRDVLAFEIDRQTPFAAADVYYDARVLRLRGDGQLEAELVVVPRAMLDAATDALGPLGDGLAGVDMAAADGRAIGVNLLADSRIRRKADPWAAWNYALALVAIIALAAGLWQMLANRRAAADAFEASTRARAVQAQRVATQKRQLIGLVAGMRFLQDTRDGRPTTVEVVDELSRRLPDSTYLEKLSIEDGRLLLIGLSSEASSLVQRLEGSPLWKSPALTGALQPDPRTRRDRFTLIAELVIAAPAVAGDKTARATTSGGADAPGNP